MKPTNYFLSLLLLVFLTSCGARKNVVPEPHPELAEQLADDPEAEEEEEEAENLLENEIETGYFDIISFAKDFLGTRYRYGGSSREGMDCSGLVYTAFSKKDIELPRSSREMAKRGEKLALEQVEIGDLLFFETNRRKKMINHVGLVVELAENVIYFIHSTTSKGVIISALDETYWQEHFVMARRIL